jgi:SSS family solute:Na+ symporter/sodium/pantothenate symporter
LLPDDPMIGQATAFRPYYLGGMEPIIWGITASLLAGVIGSLLTLPPKAAVVSLVFDARPAKEPS